MLKPVIQLNRTEISERTDVIVCSQSSQIDPSANPCGLSEIYWFNTSGCYITFETKANSTSFGTEVTFDIYIAGTNWNYNDNLVVYTLGDDEQLTKRRNIFPSLSDKDSGQECRMQSFRLPSEQNDVYLQISQNFSGAKLWGISNFSSKQMICPANADKTNSIYPECVCKPGLGLFKKINSEFLCLSCPAYCSKCSEIAYLDNCTLIDNKTSCKNFIILISIDGPQL